MAKFKLPIDYAKSYKDLAWYNSKRPAWWEPLVQMFGAGIMNIGTNAANKAIANELRTPEEIGQQQAQTGLLTAQAGESEAHGRQLGAWEGVQKSMMESEERRAKTQGEAAVGAAAQGDIGNRLAALAEMDATYFAASRRAVGGRPRLTPEQRRIVL